MKGDKQMICFRQHEIVVFELDVAFAITIFINIVLLICVKPFAPPILAILLYSLLLSFFCHKSMSSSHIEVNDEHILCRKKQNVLWEYKWDEIKAVRIGNRFRNPSVEFEFATTDRKEQRLIEEAKPYLQYGRSAKKAISQYCPYPLTKITSSSPFQRFPDNNQSEDG